MGLFRATITLVVIASICKISVAKMTIEQIKNTLKPYKNKCLKITGVDPALVEGTKTGSFPDDPKLMCFMKCIYNMMKVIKNDEVSIKAVFSTVDLMVPDEFVPSMKTILDNCLNIANEKTTDLCTKCFLMTECFYRADSSLYFFP